MLRLIVPVLFGVAGIAVLLGLGFWQVDRLGQKEAYLAQIEARLTDAPVPLPAAPDASRDRFLAVTATGSFTGEALDVLISRKEIGPGYRVIAAMLTNDGRRVLVDRGFVPDSARGLGHDPGAAKIFGNLHWPVEVDSFTPSPDAARAIWFARDVPAMAAVLGTEPVLIVARDPTGDGLEPMPVDTASIPNDHLGYAITWFSLAVVWVGMTLLLLWRITRAGRAAAAG